MNWSENGTKILGALTAVLGTLASLIAAGAFKELLSQTAIGWLNIVVSLATAGVGGATMARGFNNTTKERVASAMQDAIKATPHSGFARSMMLAFLLAITVPVAFVALPGCATFQQLGFDQQLQLSIDTASTVTRSVSNAYDAKLITQKQAQQYLALVKNARDLFAIAIELKDSDVKSAEGQLQLANDILLQLQRYLTEVQS